MSTHGWVSTSMAGATPGRLCRAKLLALGALISPMPVAWGALVLIIGRSIGVTAPAPAERLCCQLICLAIVNLAVLGAQLLASARTENQLGPLALGLAGILLSTFSQVMPLWARFLSPWTAYGLIVPADFVGPTLVDLDCHLVNLSVLAGIGGALFLAITARFDRREI